MSLHHSPRIVTSGLTTLLDAANIKSYPGSGTSWYDISSFKQTGTLVNSPTYETTNGGRFNFNASSNNYVTIPHNATTQATASITLNIFVYKTDWSTTSERFFSKTQSGSYALTSDSVAGNITAFFYIAGAYRSVNYPKSSLTGNWQYFTVSCDGRYIKLYVNAGLVGTYDYGSNPGITHSNAQLVIGAEPGGPSTIEDAYTKLTGKVSNFSIYNRVLSDTEILQNYNALKGRFGL